MLITFNTSTISNPNPISSNRDQKLSTKLLPINPLQQSQRTFHEILLELSPFIEKTVEVNPDLLYGMRIEYIKAAHDYYKSIFKSLFKDLPTNAHYKRAMLNYELSEKCHLKGVMNFSIPVKFQQTFKTVRIVFYLIPSIIYAIFTLL